jgi:hypothetical protein
MWGELCRVCGESCAEYVVAFEVDKDMQEEVTRPMSTLGIMLPRPCPRVRSFRFFLCITQIRPSATPVRGREWDVEQVSPDGTHPFLGWNCTFYVRAATGPKRRGGEGER